MSRYNQKKANFQKALKLFAVALGSIAVIVLVLPREEHQTFRYDIGKPWMYGSFIAKQDFPVYRSEALMEHLRDSVRSSFIPYFYMDKDVEQRNVGEFEKKYLVKGSGLKSEYARIIANRLHRLYQSGIISMVTYNDLGTDSTKQVRLIQGKQSELKSISYFTNTRNVYEQMFTADDPAQMKAQLRNCNLNTFIEANVIYDKKRTEAEIEDLIASIPTADEMVVTGQKIIDRGEIVDEHTARIIDSYEKQRDLKKTDTSGVVHTLLGQIIFVSMMIIFFTGYLALFRRDYFVQARSMTMLFVLIAVFPIMVSLIMEHNFFSVYIIPLSMLPIFVRVFMDSRTAFIAHVVMVSISALAVTYQFEFMAINIAAGLVAIYSLREMSSRGKVLRTALFVVVVSCIIYYSLRLMQTSELQKLDADMYIHFCVNGVLLLLAYPLMYLLEKMFGFTSDITLFELSNTNRGILRKLSEVAPGTFQHSITVGNLATEIANNIDADSLLVRVGALYHDIGKMKNPVFFTENQAAGVNPHDKLTSQQSAKVIISHVTNGEILAKKNGLPSFITDFIRTHHGAGMTKYFYIKECNAHPGEEIDKTPYTYPGPNPSTREQAILMMADAVEAASRSLKEYSEESISNLVDKIIDGQMKDGSFRECPITFQDMATAKKVLKEKLKNIYHTRIQYPELAPNP